MQITFFQIYVRKISAIWFCTNIIWVIRVVMRAIFQCRIQLKKSLLVINVMLSFWVISLARDVKTIESWSWKALWAIEKLFELSVLINRRNRDLKEWKFLQTALTINCTVFVMTSELRKLKFLLRFRTNWTKQQDYQSFHWCLTNWVVIEEILIELLRIVRGGKRAITANPKP